MGIATTEEQKPHPDDRKTLHQIGDLAYATGDIRGTLEDAYHLGRIRGAVEGAERALERFAPTTV